MPKLVLRSDELYPYYTFSENEDGSYDDDELIEVDEATFAYLQQAHTDFETYQARLEALLEARQKSKGA